MSNEEKYCLWLNEVGHPAYDRLSMLAERVPIGGYVTRVIGSKKQIQNLMRRLLKKPCLIEKYIKTLPE